MVSVSGIRGIVGESLTPDVLLTYTQAFATWLYEQKSNGIIDLKVGVPKVVIGRDTRPTGRPILDFVQSILVQSGCMVVNLDVATTPTVEVAVLEEQADGGIIISASHNPLEWNALKLLNHFGEFLTAAQGEEVKKIAASRKFVRAPWNKFGVAVPNATYADMHIQKVLALPVIEPAKIAARRYKILVDARTAPAQRLFQNCVSAWAPLKLSKLPALEMDSSHDHLNRLKKIWSKCKG